MKLGETCKHCDLVATETIGYNAGDQAVDPCLGILPGVRNACCGHGGKHQRNLPYIQFEGVTRKTLYYRPVHIVNEEMDIDIHDEDEDKRYWKDMFGLEIRFE